MQVEDWQMFDEDGNIAVSHMMQEIKQALSNQPLPKVREQLHQKIQELSKKYGEVYDTEVRYRISSRLSSFGTMQKEGWLSGVHFLADALRTAIVAIHQLPQMPETLWLRLLGRGSVQSQAIIELQALPLNHPYQKATLELVYNLRENLRVNQELETDDRELVMRLEPLYQRDREQAKQEGRQEGRQEGEQHLIIRQINRRVGEINESLIERIKGLSIEQLENLGEALLDFSNVADLETWLNQ
ncbi:DUF4351 domain-containing protein [Nostoc sp. UHCC 0251]|uniref:DUF4351 domain-containing protein n=1 Tax=Nostoc sp. UHCC 0251 TaxID=3110240 RepID=UPI002B21C962|nr:DUF4351 domain-containing protein [Nostoc sp. UHCC 0251]MEA5622349.1 DUF4351 domain-containing protein [Nostoc sp. UHCC 0251]